MVGLGPVVADQAPVGQYLVLPATGLRAVERWRQGGARRGDLPEVGVEIPSQVIEFQCAAAGLRLKVPPAHTPTGVRDFIPLPPILMVSAAQFPKARSTAARRRNFRLVGCAPFK